MNEWVIAIIAGLLVLLVISNRALPPGEPECAASYVTGPC